MSQTLRTEGKWWGGDWMSETDRKRTAEANIYCSPSSRWRFWWKALYSDCVFMHLPRPDTLSHSVPSFSQMDHDPRNPTYISSQGPLPSTVADFWQVTLIFIHAGFSSFTVYFRQKWEFRKDSHVFSVQDKSVRISFVFKHQWVFPKLEQWTNRTPGLCLYCSRVLLSHLSHKNISTKNPKSYLTTLCCYS